MAATKVKLLFVKDQNGYWKGDGNFYNSPQEGKDYLASEDPDSEIATDLAAIEATGAYGLVEIHDVWLIPYPISERINKK